MSLQFILVKSKTGYDISGIVQKTVWSGRKNSPARSLQLELMDDPALGGNNRAGVDVYSGNHLIFLEDGSELFRGIIMRQTQTQGLTLSVTAYDYAIYLSNNKDGFSYRKKTVTEIFLDVCKRYGISRGTVASVAYKIPVLVETNTTIYDLLCNALSQTYKATGERFYIMSKGGKLHLMRRKEQLTKVVLETGQEGSEYGNLTQYSYSKDITNTKTRLKLISQNGKVMAQWFDSDLEEKIGMMQDVQTPDDKLKNKQLKTLVITMLDGLKKPAESLTVTAFGISTIYSGVAVYISIPEIGVGRTFYVDSDTHTWDGDYHTMQLTLNFASDIESINDGGEAETDQSTDSSATKKAQQAIKDAARALKEKKKAESRVIKAGKAAEKAADAAEKALKNAEKAADAAEKALKNAEKAANKPKTAAARAKTVQVQATKAGTYLKTAQTQAARAQSEHEKSKAALEEVRPLLNISQSMLTSNAEFAVQQAESSARRAVDAAKQSENAVKRAGNAAEKAKQYL